MTRRIHVLNGPNLVRLGRRQPAVYGSVTHDDLAELCVGWGRELGVEVVVRQSDHEGELLGWIHEIADAGEPLVINAGGLTHTSVVLRDACAEVADGAGFVEVHLSNVHAREEFRHHSLLSPLAAGVVVGLGVRGYEYALRALTADAPR